MAVKGMKKKNYRSSQENGLYKPNEHISSRAMVAEAPISFFLSEEVKKKRQIIHFFLKSLFG